MLLRHDSGVHSQTQPHDNKDIKKLATIRSSKRKRTGFGSQGGKEVGWSL